MIFWNPFSFHCTTSHQFMPQFSILYQTWESLSFFVPQHKEIPFSSEAFVVMRTRRPSEQIKARPGRLVEWGCSVAPSATSWPPPCKTQSCHITVPVASAFSPPPSPLPPAAMLAAADTYWGLARSQTRCAPLFPSHVSFDPRKPPKRSVWTCALFFSPAPLPHPPFPLRSPSPMLHGTRGLPW